MPNFQQCLAQACPRLRFGTVAPKQLGDAFARHMRSWARSEIGYDGLGLPATRRDLLASGPVYQAKTAGSPQFPAGCGQQNRLCGRTERHSHSLAGARDNCIARARVHPVTGISINADYTGVGLTRTTSRTGPTARSKRWMVASSGSEPHAKEARIARAPPPDELVNARRSGSPLSDSTCRPSCLPRAGRSWRIRRGLPYRSNPCA